MSEQQNNAVAGETPATGETQDNPVANIVIALGLLGVALFLYFDTLGYKAGAPGDPGSAAIPRLVVILIVIASGCLLVSSVLKIRRDGVQRATFGIWQVNNPVIWVVVSILLEVLLLPVLGFVAATVLTLTFIGLIVGSRWWVALIVAVGSAVICFYLFGVLFAVPLPQGIFL